MWAKSWLKAMTHAMDTALHNIQYNLQSSFKARHHNRPSHYCSCIYSPRRGGAVILHKGGLHLSKLHHTSQSSYTFAAHTYNASSDTGPRTHALPASFDSDSFQIAIDNCASYSMTNSESDFIDTPTVIQRPVLGLGQQTATKQGTVRWHITDDDGRVHAFTIPGVLLLPDLPFRVLSPQHWSQNLHLPSHCVTFKDSILLTWNGGDNKRTIRLSNNSNVGILKSAPSYSQATAFIAEVTTTIHNPLAEATCFSATHGLEDSTPTETDEEDEVTVKTSNHYNSQSTTVSQTDHAPIDFHDDYMDSNNSTTFPEKALSDDEAELMRWHLRLGHTSFDKLRVMANNGTIPKQLLDCEVPKCAGCMYGKMTRRAWRTKQAPSKVAPAPINAPGDCISVDQLESTSPGFIGQMKGALTNKRYKFATVFVDHFSRLSYVHLQQTNSAVETLEAKRAFEKFAAAHAVQVRHYHADNGRFADNLWLSDIAQRGQSISFCGANAHFQNGVAEKRIRDLQEAARTILLDAKSRWPKAISACLWPYALRHANHAHAQTPSRMKHHGGRTPYEIFVNSTIQPNVKDFHPFGCPIYVLEDNLATGKTIPKWMPRARLGIYLGFSPNHARNVALVLNPNTGLVSPQYHVKFDDLFETTRNPRNNAIDLATWQVKAGFKERKDGVVINAKPVDTATTTIPMFPRENLPLQPVIQQLDDVHMPSVPTDEPNITVPEGDTIANQQQDDDSTPQSQHQQTETPTLRRTTRTRRPTEAMRSYLETRDLAFPIAFESLAEIGLWDFEYDDPIAYMAKSGDPDTMYLDDALKAPDCHEFIKAMQHEVTQHEERQHWEMIPRSQVPAGTKVLPAVWSMKRKRRVATGEVYKHKARLNIGGHKQEYGVNFWETYSPVVNWFTIRLFLTLALIFHWYTRQIDFVLAFPQADVECDMYMAIPRGFTLPEGHNEKDYCLHLLKNVYGQKQAGRVWNKYLHNGLISMGFEQSNIDECLYYRGSTIFLVYVDDGIIIDSDKSRIDAIFDEFKSHNFEVTDEGDLKDYLGVDISPQSDGSIHLSQSKLIEQILNDMNFQDNTTSVPCPARVGVVLTKHTESDEHKADWHYRSIIGKLNFLEKSTRPDLAFAVHNAARFSSDPREPHSDAVKRICRYLVGTRNKGYYMQPDYNLGFEVYADADFAGTWNKDTAENDPATAQSRAGYLIRLAGCPILWASRLMREICLSTTEAEYCCLSEALRQVIPLMNIITELHDRKLLKDELLPVIKCTAFEDNSGALELARAPRMRPRTKHINIKYHHFRHYVAEGLIKIEPIDTLDQLADIFTKAVSRDLFFKFRKLIMGW